MLGPEEVAFLKKVSVFAALRDEVLASFGHVAQRCEVAAGEVVFAEGEPAKEMIVVLSGRLEVVKRSRSGAEARIAVLGPGDVVGEMSLVDIQPRSAAVRATEPAVVASFRHADIANVYREDPQSYTLLVLNIAREISIRLRRMDAMLANILAEIDEVTGQHRPRAG
ncbi:MAG: cyclic nucleotide-binding domain-containing protein [Deltaproteobacteria bacterium]|nr:MAG: cyclic nucleotide-binding domain-containing protein [Deltaproteobacteria bacterium]